MFKVEKYIILFLLLVFGGIYSSKGQEIMINDTINNDVIYYFDRNYGILAHNRGFGAYVSFGKNTSAFRRTGWDFSIKTLKHPKELENYFNNQYENPQPFKYGKMHDILILSGHRSFHHLINDKPYWGGVEVRYFYSGGINIAFAKPKYYRVAKWVTNSTYTEDIVIFDLDIPFSDFIGPSTYFKGFGEMNFYPGINLEGGFTFDFSKSNQISHKIEISTTLDLYPIPLPIMAQFNPEFYIIGFQIKYLFGPKFN